jgi:crotonobetainyl-CoA:carnitine CoA-transferase CaiB-like acyl-CoA transferase
VSSAVNHSVPVRRGNRSDKVAPQGVYRCHGPDDWCALSVQTDQQWNSLVRVIAQPKWASDDRFGSAAGRMDHHDEIDRGIEAWTRQFSSTEVESRLKAAQIPAERVRRIKDVIDNPHTDTIFSSMAEPRVGSMLTTTLPFTLSSVALPVARSAPSLGEHNVEVLRQWFNIADEEVLALRSEEALK